MALNCASDKFVGRDVALEYAIACGDVDPETLSWAPIGALRGKSISMSADTVDTTADDSQGSFRETLVTFKSFELSTDGISRADSAVSNQQALRKHFIEDPTPYVWLRLTSPLDTIVAFCILTEFSAEAPYDDVATFSITAAATSRPGGLPSVIYTITPQAPTGVTVSPATATVQVGDDVTLTATVQPVGAPQAVTWTTSDALKATVSNGVVTGVGAGAVTITATSVADPTKSATCAVTVEV